MHYVVHEPSSPVQVKFEDQELQTDEKSGCVWLGESMPQGLTSSRGQTAPSRTEPFHWSADSALYSSASRPLASLWIPAAPSGQRADGATAVSLTVGTTCPTFHPIVSLSELGFDLQGFLAPDANVGYRKYRPSSAKTCAQQQQLLLPDFLALTQPLLFPTVMNSDFYGRDLETVRSAAGLFNLTVEEFISRLRNPAASLGVAHQGYDEGPVFNHANSTADPTAFTTSTQAPPQVGSTSNDPWYSQRREELPGQLVARPSRIQTESANIGVTQVSDPTVYETVLLNEPTFACDDFANLTGDVVMGDDGLLLVGDLEDWMENEDHSFIDVTPTKSKIDEGGSGESSYLVVPSAASAASPTDNQMDWAVIASPVSSESDVPATSPTTASDPAVRPNRATPRPKPARFASIAPKPGRAGMIPAPIHSAPFQKVRKKRARYGEEQRRDAHQVRQLKSCVRCRSQRVKCIPDQTNPKGPCLTCQKKITRLSPLPCLRYKITDISLFRTGLPDSMPFYAAHPMNGPFYGDFHLPKAWTPAQPKIISIGQLQTDSVGFQIELSQFVPSGGTTDVDLKGRPMYSVPWAIRDPDAVVDSINAYIEENSRRYYQENLENADPQVQLIFNFALRTTVLPVPNRMLQKALRLWVASRFMESKWRFWGDDDIAEMSPKDPFYDWQSLPPYLDYQIASIFIHRILSPLRKDVLRDLQSLVNDHRPEDFLVTFLTSFVLLHNYELQMEFQAAFASRRNDPRRFMDMSLVNASNSGAKTILAHFHYCCKGQQPFKAEFDWSSPKTKRMARLDSEQSDFMANCRAFVIGRMPEFQLLNHTKGYHKKFWYTSQLFDPEWEPRDTPEHSPPANSDE